MTEKKIVKTPAPAAEVPAEDPCAQHVARIAELETLLAEAQAELAAKPSGRAGWMVTTPTPYNGSTAGVIFRKGKAFLPEGEEGKRLAHFLADEFGYKVEFVTDWQAIPQSEQIGKTLIDVLMLPDRR